MRFWVDAWDPSYVAGAPDDEGPTEPSTAQLDPEVELPADAWAPIPPPPDVRAPDTVLLVDGVRRIDAVVWTDEGHHHSYPGVCISYAAGVVRCDLRRGNAELAESEVKRGLFTASPTATDIESGQVRYRVHMVKASDVSKLAGSAQGPLTRLEMQVAATARKTVHDPGALLVVDGPLRGRNDLAQAIGYDKTHRSSYLPPPLTAVVNALAPGQRSPVFRLGTRWSCYTWYLRLPGGTGAPWSGMVRVECSVNLTPTAAIGLADLSAITLPRFAASAYKDPRAPQNLVPIGGLEHRLRARLGDPRLLHRALTRAATRS